MKKYLLALVSAAALSTYAGAAPVEANYDSDYNLAATAVAPVAYQRCASRGYRYAGCTLPYGAQYVRLVVQHSRTTCYLNHNWGVNYYNQIWVDNGCDATFEVTTGYGYPDYRRYPRNPRFPRYEIPRRPGGRPGYEYPRNPRRPGHPGYEYPRNPRGPGRPGYEHPRGPRQPSPGNPRGPRGPRRGFDASETESI